MIGNIPKNINYKPSHMAQMLIGYIPILKLLGLSNKSAQRWNMSVWGRFALNSFTEHNPWLLNAFGFSPSARCLRISIVSFWFYGSDHEGKPRSLGTTTHCRHRFSMQQATRHCSGKSAIYAARMVCTQRTHPSAYVISIPSLPTIFSGSSNDSIHWWNSW